MPLLHATLGSIRILSTSHSNGFGVPAQWHVALAHPPHAVAIDQAHMPNGARTYLALEPKALEWSVHAFVSIEAVTGWVRDHGRGYHRVGSGAAALKQGAASGKAARPDL